jgi:DNA-binding beta-propeller fold protein YncE
MNTRIRPEPSLAVVLVLALACFSSLASAKDASYRFLQEIRVGDEGGWDYLSVDAEARLLYVSHATKVVVIDLETNKVVGEIADTPGVHGFAVAHDLGLGFASNGRENKASLVELKSRKTLSKTDTGENPDAILYVPTTKEVYAFNGRGHSATIFEAKTGKTIATVPLPGKPEFAVFDPSSNRVYNNIEDQNEVVVLDAGTHQIAATWPIAPGESASGMAIDVEHHRIFVVCENKLMLMMDTSSGKIVASVPIGKGVDAASYDDATGLAFSSNGEGNVTIAHEDGPNALRVVQTIATVRSARTMTLDPKTHRIYLSAADLEPTPAGERPKPLPGTFRVLVYGPAE